MEVIKPREGFFQNIVNYTTIGNYIKEKLKGREDSFSFKYNKYSLWYEISIYYKGNGDGDVMLSKLADELNNDFVNGLCLFICSGNRVCLNGDFDSLKVDEEEGVCGQDDRLNGYAVLEAPSKYGDHTTNKVLRPGRIDTDLRNLVSIVSERYGFIDDNGMDAQSSFTLDYAEGYWFSESEFLDLMYSIKCSTPEVAEEFAKKWVFTIQEEYRKNHRYEYLIGTMVDPVIMNPEYLGCNRVYGDPSILIGFVYTDRLMSCEHVHIFDKSQLPSKSDWWFK